MTTDKTQQNDTASQNLLDLIEHEKVELFSTESNHLYASFKVGERTETFPVTSSKFSSYLERAYYMAHNDAVSNITLDKCLRLCRAKAQFDDKKAEVYLRTAPIDGGIEIDLNNTNGDCVKVTAKGWEITKPTNKFYRPEGSLPLPTPKRGGDLNKLWNYLNVSESDRALMLGWLLAAFRPDSIYPLLIIQGEQNCAKSTTMSNLKALIDPARADRAGMVKDVKEAFISARNSWVMSFDNLQAISDSLSDAFCRLSTGGAHKQRKLYADGEEFTIEATRPVILNGIEDIASRPDLESRSIILNLPKLKERKSEEEMKRKFNEDKPELLGALMDALVFSVQAIGQSYSHPKIRFPAVIGWVAKAETQLGFQPGAFEWAWSTNQEQAKIQNLDLDPLSRTIIGFMRDYPLTEWRGSASNLLTLLERRLRDGVKKPHGWPTSPRGLSGQLSRIADNLAEVGLEYGKTQRQGKLRPIVLTKTEKFEEATVTFVTADEEVHVIPQSGFEELTH